MVVLHAGGLGVVSVRCYVSERVSLLPHLGEVARAFGVGGRDVRDCLFWRRILFYSILFLPAESTAGPPSPSLPPPSRSPRSVLSPTASTTCRVKKRVYAENSINICENIL